MQRIRQQANELGRSAPKFCPRIRLTIEDSDVTGERQPGWGSLSQVHDDLKRLEALGAEHVTLDWFTGDLEAPRTMRTAGRCWRRSQIRWSIWRQSGCVRRLPL